MIIPIGKNILIAVDTVKKVGDLQTEGKKTMNENGKVLAVGSEVTLDIKKGDTVLVKGWAIDSINYEKQEYFFVNEESGGICGVVKT